MTATSGRSKALASRFLSSAIAARALRWPSMAAKDSTGPHRLRCGLFCATSPRLPACGWRPPHSPCLTHGLPRRNALSSHHVQKLCALVTVVTETVQTGASPIKGRELQHHGRRLKGAERLRSLTTHAQAAPRYARQEVTRPTKISSRFAHRARCPIIFT